jgi:hypothetical protein
MTTMNLQDVLEEQRLLLEAITRGEYCCLKHGLPYITPSILSAQAFCEYKAVYELIESPRKPTASEAREFVKLVLRAKRFLPRKIEGYFALDTPLAALVNSVPVIGRPHSIVFVNGYVRAIVIGKVSKKHQRLYISDRVKLYAYGLLAAKAGLPLGSYTRLILVTASTKDKLLDALRATYEWLKVGGSYPPKSQSYTIHFLAHDEALEEELLAPLLAYWRGERGEKPNPGPWCETCPFREKCPLSFPHKY